MVNTLLYDHDSAEGTNHQRTIPGILLPDPEVLMNKQPEVTAATRNRIADAFLDLYEKKPIEKIRIQEVSDLAHVNRSTFYKYFQDIYAVLEFVEQRTIDDICTLSDIEDTDPDLLSVISSVYTRNGRVMNILLGENSNGKFLGILKKALYETFLKKQHLFDAVQMELIYEYSLTGLIMAFHWWYNHQDEMDMDEFILTTKSLIQNGTYATLRSTLETLEDFSKQT